MFDDLAKELDRGDGETNPTFSGALVGNPTTENNQYLDKDALGLTKSTPLEAKIITTGDGMNEEESRRNKENNTGLGHFQRIKRSILDMLPIKGKRKRAYTKETVKNDEDKGLLGDGGGGENSSLSSKRLKSTVNEEIEIIDSEYDDENRRLVGDSPDSVSGNTESVKIDKGFSFFDFEIL